MKCKPVTEAVATEFALSVNHYDGLSAGKILDEVGAEQWSDLVTQARQLKGVRKAVFGGDQEVPVMFPHVALQRLGVGEVRLLATETEIAANNGLTEVLIPLADSQSKCEK